MNPESAGIKTVYLALFDRIKKKKNSFSWEVGENRAVGHEICS